MSTEKPKKKEQDSCMKTSWPSPVEIEPDAESAVITEQWYARQQLCLAIALGFGHFNRDSRLAKKWKESPHGVVALSGLKGFVPGCSLKTFTLASIVISIKKFADDNKAEGKRTTQIMMATISDSCSKALRIWVSYQAYEARVERFKDDENVDAE